ncbi:MAG: acyl-CoA thioesterase [Desulfonatronovibrionaceae bacterium]
MYEYHLQVTSQDIDGNGHVNNVRYLQWLQDAAIAHSDAVGWTQKEYDRLGATWIVRRHEIDYFHPAFVRDRLIVYTWVKEFRRIRCLRSYEMLRPKDGLCLARAQTVWVFMDTQTGRPRTIPEDMARDFAVQTHEAAAK